MYGHFLFQIPQNFSDNNRGMRCSFTLVIGLLGALHINVLCQETTLRWYTASPWQHYPTDSAGISLVGHIPVLAQNLHEPGIVSRWGNPGLKTPQAKHYKGFAEPSIQLRLPLTRESSLSLSYRTQAQLRWTREQEKNYSIHSDTSDKGNVSQQEWLQYSASADGLWTVLEMNYSVNVSQWLDLSIQIEHHQASLNGFGSATGYSRTQWEIPGEESGEEEFGESELNSSWSGKFSGSAWSAGLSTRIGRFRYRGQMGMDLQLDGQFSLQQTIPFYKDSVSLDSRNYGADTWLSPQMHDSLLSHQTFSQQFRTKEPLHFRIPQLHQLGIEIEKWLYVDYTYWTGHFRTSSEKDSITTAIDFRRFANYDINLNHLFLAHANTSWFLSELGCFWIHKRIEPVVSASFRIPWKPISWLVQVDALPLIRLYCGVGYAL